MQHRTILPVLDTHVRNFLLANADIVQETINDAACWIARLELDPGDAVTRAHEELCDSMANILAAPTNEQADGLASFLEACIKEIVRTCSSETRPHQFLKVDGYFTGDTLELMCAHAHQFSCRFREMLALYQQDKADLPDVMQYTAARFCERLEEAGHRQEPSFRQAILEYAMLATFIVMATEDAMSPRP